MHEVFQQVLNLVSTSGSLMTWDETLPDTFLIGLYQQLSDLEMCLGKEKGVAESPLASENSRLAVKRYFRGISMYLKEREYSHSAWEIVRVEISRCLFSVNKLTGKFRK